MFIELICYICKIYCSLKNHHLKKTSDSLLRKKY